MALEVLFVFAIDMLSFLAFYGIINLSLNLECGLTGIPNFGKVLSVAGGAYTVAVLPVRLGQWILHIGPELDPLKDSNLLIHMITLELAKNPLASALIIMITLFAAMIIGAILGYVSSYPAIRLRSDYLGITLLSLGEIQRIIAMNVPFITAGTVGIQVPDVLAGLGENRFAGIAVLLLIVFLIVAIYLIRVEKAPLGRTLRAVRENELTAESIGKPTVQIRKKALIIGSSLGALGGALYALYAGSVTSVTFTRIGWTIIPWLAMMVGGRGNSYGVIGGTLIVVFVRRLISIYKDYLDFLPFNVVNLQYPIFALVIILIVLYKPKGILPEKPSAKQAQTQNVEQATIDKPS